MSNKVGINLIEMLIDDFNGKEIEVKRNTIENIGWIEQLVITSYSIHYTKLYEKGKLAKVYGSSGRFE